MKKIFLILILALALITAAYAHDHNFTEAKELIDSGVGCNELSDEQLEMIGDYYMEQMHPGEAHELMDEMMGGEGSESLRLAHISMAKRFYCGEYYRNMGMMGGMMMQGGGNNMAYNTMGYGMMGSMSFGTTGVWLYSIFWLVLATFIFSVIFWLTYNWLAKERKKR